MSRLLILALLFLGCANGRSVVLLTVDGQVSGIESFAVTVTLNGTKSQIATIVPSGAPVNLPPPVRLALIFDPDKKGTATVHIDAIGSSGVLASGDSTRFELAPSKEANVTVTVAGSSSGDMGPLNNSDLAIDMTGLPHDLSTALDMTRPIDMTPPVVAPKLIAPLSTSTVTSQQPTLKWQLPMGATGVAIDICHDRPCANKLSTAVAIDATGTVATPTAPLPAGVLFWHVRAMVNGTLQTSATWEFWVGTRTASKASTSFGTILDANGDGYADVIVAADTATNTKGESSAGRAHLYFGGPSGLSAPQLLDGPDGANAGFGVWVASAGDINGDGYADVIVGAVTATNTKGESRAGRAHLYFGGPSGLSASSQVLDGPDGVDALFGVSVASAGDVNGDGYADVIVGAYNATNTKGEQAAGRAHLYLGGPSGLSTSPQLLDGPDGASAYFGQALASAGDVNGDGYADVVVGAYYATNTKSEQAAGRAHLYLGGPSGLSTSPQLLDGPDGANAWFGFSASAGDINGDGYADVIIGAVTATNTAGQSQAGRAHLYLGGPSGLSTSPQLLDGPDGANARFGSVASAGDIDGDGYADVVVGADRATNTAGQSQAGRAHVYLGGPSGLSASPVLLDGPDDANALFGFSVASAGDINGDGYADVIIGAAYATSQAGRAHLYLGGSSGLSTSPQLLDDPDGADALFGESVASAGDVNRDRRGAVITCTKVSRRVSTRPGRGSKFFRPS
jgi:hypothetical protein